MSIVWSSYLRYPARCVFFSTGSLDYLKLLHQKTNAIRLNDNQPRPTLLTHERKSKIITHSGEFHYQPAILWDFRKEVHIFVGTTMPETIPQSSPSIGAFLTIPNGWFSLQIPGTWMHPPKTCLWCFYICYIHHLEQVEAKLKSWVYPLVN